MFDFSEIQNKLIVEEKLNMVYAAILTAHIKEFFSDKAKEAVSDWVLGKDISDTKIGENTVKDIVNEIKCTPIQAVCILNAVERDIEIFEDAVLTMWKDEIRDE